MQSEILFESQKKYLLTALFMQKMLEPENSSEKALNLAVFSTKSGGFVVFFSSINCDLYHYAGNNPVKYTDPDGNFDIDNFFSGIIDLFTPEQKQYSKFEVYNSKEISKDEYTYYQNNMSELEQGSIITNSNEEYTLLTPSEFGKMNTTQKLDVLNCEKKSLIQSYEANKSEGKDALKNLAEGFGESLFSAGSNSNVEEFVTGFVINNSENLGDLAQFDLDEINYLKDLNYIDSLIDLYSSEQ